MVTPPHQHPRSGLHSGLNARSAKRFLTQAFLEAGLPFAENDALEIILNAAGFDRTSLMLQGAEFLEPEVLKTISEHMERRLSGEPVDHILGWREFFGRRFMVSSDVLSPRADTETLIRGALQRSEKASAIKMLDLGTGSGAIGLTLLAERPATILHATDISLSALNIAKTNAKNLDVSDRVSFFNGEWFDAISSEIAFDMILSNPPYISHTAMKQLETEVSEYDPDIALRGGVDGLNAYRVIISSAADYLESKGWLGLEIGFDQAEALKTLVSDVTWTDVTVDQDLGGNDRTVWVRKKA